MFWDKLKESYIRLFRRKLAGAGADALPQLAFLGLISGALTAGVILIFRYALEWPLAYFLPDQNAENFEGLPWLIRGALPLSGAVIIGLIWYKLQISQRKTGVAYVMERLGYHQGYITFRSALTQFFAGIVTIGSGQSAGREGPAIHLGAACASLLGQKMKLPNNSIRTLVGCGTAAAISSSFDTPIAGVIFAMEVVMMEYTIAGFIPVMLASVTATTLIRALDIHRPLFDNPITQMTTLWELPYIAALGLIIGCAAALFITILKIGARQSDKPIEWRLIIAGLITGCCAIVVPEVRRAP